MAPLGGAFLRFIAKAAGSPTPPDNPRYPSMLAWFARAACLGRGLSVRLNRVKYPLIEKTFPASVLGELQRAGFECATIGQNPERIRVMKHHCAAIFERQASGELKLHQPPGYFIRGEIGRLWDAGYQKFWLLGPPTEEPWTEPRRPALADQLKELHRFSEELKAVLGVPSFINESLGTTSEVTTYDRLASRMPRTGPPPH